MKEQVLKEEKEKENKLNKNNNNNEGQVEEKKDQQQQQNNQNKQTKKKKGESFLERNYNKQFKEQQKIFDGERERKKKQKEYDENNYEKIDPPVWKASLALMKYQVQKDNYMIQDNQRLYVNEDNLINQKNAVQQYHDNLHQKSIQQLKDRTKKGVVNRTVSVQVQMNSTDIEQSGFKKAIQKSDDQIQKDVTRLIAIDQRNNEKSDKKVITYFIRILDRYKMLYSLQPGLEKEAYRKNILNQFKDNEKLFNQINEQIIQKYSVKLIENIIDDLLYESVFLLQAFEKKQKMTKKQLRNTVLNEYKNCFIEYFNDAQQAMLDLVYVGGSQNTASGNANHAGSASQQQNQQINQQQGKSIYKNKYKQQQQNNNKLYDNDIFIETGYGLLLSSLDQANRFKQHSLQSDYNLPNNIALLNLIARDLAYELVDEAANNFDNACVEFTDSLVTNEFT